jgi:hypothetical protein
MTDAAQSSPTRRLAPLLVMLALLALQATVLHLDGQPAICRCGVVRLWQGVVASPENSQQIADWYTPSHVIHGMLFYALTRLLAPGLPLPWRLVIAVGIEVSWEIVENSPMIIDRYRQQALAEGYSGDSILNSLSDSLAMVAGFALAARLKPWHSIVLALAMEITTAVVVRDNLTLNVVQLIAPSERIARWQEGH